MKKHGSFIILVIAAALSCLAFTACGGKEESAPAPPSAEPSITLSRSELSLVMGQQTTIVATVENYDGMPSWTSSDDTKVTVSNGRVTAIADGTAVVTASIGQKSASVSITVSSEESVTLNRTSAKVFRGETVKVTATVRRGLVIIDTPVEWSTSDETIATVDENGVVTGVKVGKEPVTLTAATASGKSATCAITVAQVATVKLSETELTLHPNANASAELTATGKLGSLTINASSISWKSSDPNVADITVRNGKATVTAKKSGKAVITAQVSGTEETAVCTVDSWYRISAPADMEYMRDDINGTFKLVNDIDFKGATWDGVTKWAGDDVPDSSYFGGVLDGQGYSIRNINILSGWNNGIIGQTAPSSVVRNLSVVNLVNQDTSNKVGSVVSFNKGLIENCYIENEIRSDSQNSWNSHGGIVATNAQTGVIRNCIVVTRASREFKNCGAIVGYNTGAVENCYAICPDAMLPLYGEWQSSLGYFKNCGVFASAEALASSAELFRYSERIWTVTGYDIPALYHYPEVDFGAPITYLAQGGTYTIQPSNIKGVDIDWTVDGNDGQLAIKQNPDGSLNVTAVKKGEVTLRAGIYNGSEAETLVVVTGTVLSPESDSMSLDCNNPSRSDSDRVRLTTDKGETVDYGVTYSSSDENVATVDESGTVTAVGAGECEINVNYNGDEYVGLVKVSVRGWTRITTPEEFSAMRSALGLNYCLVGDIDFEGAEFETITPWTESDNDKNYFHGTFDGNGFSVKNVTIVGNNRGIWGRTGTSAVIENTVFDNIVFKPEQGATQQTTFGVVSFNTGIIQNCIVRATAYAGNSTDYRSGGPICGTNEFRGRIFNCITYIDASNVKSGFVASVMSLCQGVAKDCIGIVTASSSANVGAINFINSSGVSEVKQFQSEEAAISAYAPFGSFSRSVWEIKDNSLPTLKKLASSN